MLAGRSNHIPIDIVDEKPVVDLRQVSTAHPNLNAKTETRRPETIGNIVLVSTPGRRGHAEMSSPVEPLEQVTVLPRLSHMVCLVYYHEPWVIATTHCA